MNGMAHPFKISVKTQISFNINYLPGTTASSCRSSGAQSVGGCSQFQNPIFVVVVVVVVYKKK
jgi:hypothetical protein